MYTFVLFVKLFFKIDEIKFSFSAILLLTFFSEDLIRYFYPWQTEFKMYSNWLYLFLDFYTWGACKLGCLNIRFSSKTGLCSVNKNSRIFFRINCHIALLVVLYKLCLVLLFRFKHQDDVGPFALSYILVLCASSGTGIGLLFTYKEKTFVALFSKVMLYAANFESNSFRTQPNARFNLKYFLFTEQWLKKSVNPRKRWTGTILDITIVVISFSWACTGVAVMAIAVVRSDMPMFIPCWLQADSLLVWTVHLLEILFLCVMGCISIPSLITFALIHFCK